MLAEVQVSVMSFRASEEQLQQQQFVMHIIQITRFVIQFCSDGGGLKANKHGTSVEGLRGGQCIGGSCLIW